MSNVFDNIVNDSLGSSKAEQPDEKLSKRVTLSYGQVSTPLPLVTSSASGSAVNPVVFSSPDGQDKSISTTAVTRSEPEQINDFDQLKQFTIPKKRKAKKELLESIRLDSREFQHDVLPVIQQSFKSHNARNYFTFLQAKLVHNAQLFSQFVERRKQMRHEGYSEKEVQDSYAFMCVDSEPEASKICKHGLHVGHSTLTCLGNPQMGLYLSRHADIVRASPFLPGFSGILLVFKIMKGKLKLMAESASNAALDPTPNYDCHMSKAVSADVFSMMPQQAFEATQMYIYEYGDLDLEEQPRQICPYAMVHFCHTGDQQVYRRPTLVSQHAIKPSQRPTSALKSVVSQRAPYLARQQSNPQHAPLSPTIDIPSDPAMPVLTVERERKVGDCAIPTELRRVSEGVASTEPRRVGEETMGGGGGLIVWEGEVTTRGCVLCNAELVSYCGGIKPARIGQELPLDCGQPLVKLKDKCFSHVTTLEKCEEVMADNRHYTYCELRPTKTTQGKFNQIMTFLAKRQIGIIIRLPDNILMVMLTNSELTQNLGLSEAHSHPFLLHCVFISSVSRHVQLQERLGRQPQQGSKVPHLNPLTQTHDNELPKLNRFTSRSAPNLVQESLHDEDFRKFVPLTSLVYRDTLSIDFEIQANVQDQHNIDIARGIITPSRQPGHGDGALHQVVPLSGVVERGFGMEKRQVLPQSSPIGSHSMPELSGGIHCHQVSPSSMSHGPMPVHHSHSFDQSPRLSRDIEPEFAAPCGQYSDPSIAFHSGQSNMPYGRPQVNDGYTAAVQQPRHSSQSYGEHRGAAHLLPSPPMPQLQQPHWPSTQTLTYPQVSYTRPASTTTHTTPNVPRQVSDPRLLRNRCSTADGLHSTPATSIAPFGAMNAAAVTTIQNQNLVERLSVGPSLSTGTSVQRHLMSTSPSSTGQVTGRICGTASMAQPLTERRITGDDRHVETTLKTGSADGAADGTKGFRSGGVTVVNSCSDVRATNLELVPTPVDLLVPPGGRQSGFKLKSSSMEIDEMSDDLVDQIVRGCALTARLKPAMTLSADTCPPSLPLDSHPAMTVATPVADCVTSQQLSHEISEEMAKIKMLKNKMQTVAAIATATTTSSVPFLSFGSVSMPKVQIAPSVVAVHTINTATTETAMLTPTNQKSDSSKRHHHRISKQTVAASKPSGGKKEKEKDKGKRKKSTSVIRTANDMKLFLNANKGHKRDRRVTKRTVTQKKTDPRTTKGVGMKKSRVEHTKQKPLSNISQSAQSAHLDILKSLKALTHSPTKSKSSLVERGNAADKQTLVAGNTSHHKIHVSGSGLNFPDAVGQSKKFYLSQSLCLKVSIQNDSRPPEGGTGVGSIGDEIIDSMDLVGIRDIGDTDELDGIASPPHEVVSEFEIPEIPAAAQVASAGDTGLPPLTQQSTDAVHQKTVSFLKDITPQIFSPILAAKGLDPFNRVLFEGATVHVGGAIDDIAVTFTRDTSDLKSDVGDKLEKDEMLEQCLFEAMHRYESEESEPETEAEMEMTDLWHISLHYLLPIIDWLQLHNREVMEDSDRGEEGKENTAPTAVLGQKPDTLTAAATAPEATAATAETTTAAAETTAAVTSAVTTETATASPLVTSSTAVSTPMAVVITPIQPTGPNQTTVAGGKATTSSNSSTDRFHPYRRPSRQSLAIQERLTSYNEARDLDELMSCLTSPCYKGRRKQLGRFGPLLNLFARPQLYHTARFDTYNYTPDTIRDTTTMGDREMEMRDVPYKAEEIPNYNERKEKANILDKHINSSSTSNDQQMAALNAEQQFYPVASTENTVEVQSGKLGDAKDGTSAATTSGKTMASVANARRSSPPTRL